MIFVVSLVLLAVASLSVEAGPTCPESDGSFPIYIPNIDCSSYWQCTSGTPYKLYCPENRHFNPILNFCDFPENAGCKGNGGDDENNSGGHDQSNSSDDGSSSESGDSSSSSSSESQEA